MSAPNISSYKDALRTPEHSLQQLSCLQPVPGVHDDFYFSSGNFAVVFKMEDTRDGSFKALKCFTRDQDRRRDSLHLIFRYLRRIQKEYIIPYTFLDNEIWADGADHPVLLMDWIEGETLGEHVSKLCESHDRHGLERLCQEFVRLSLWLLDQPWAHGDLKHDNILVRPDGSLVLVDYDGCFVPGMGGQEAREMGSPSFRHPKRTITDFDRHLDDFSILVIFLSLRILVAEPTLRQEKQDGENLVLGIEDITTPSTSALLGNFRQHSDSFLKAGIALLDMAVCFTTGKIIGLKELLKLWLDNEGVSSNQENQNMLFIRGGAIEIRDLKGDVSSGWEDIYLEFVNAFWLAKFQLTFHEYDEYCKASNLQLPDDGGWGRGHRPVINIDWYDAIEYCNWRSEKEGLQLVYYINKHIDHGFENEKRWEVYFNRNADGYRLPTEVEWEYAAKAGMGNARFGNGKDIANPKEVNFFGLDYKKKAYSVVGEYRERTVPVGSLDNQNAFGLYDMSGNVWEWCWDWHLCWDWSVYMYITYKSCLFDDTPARYEFTHRVCRGGSWASTPDELRVSHRHGCEPDTRSKTVGFRIARKSGK